MGGCRAITLTTGTDIINGTTHLLNSGASNLNYFPGSGNDEFLASGGTLDNTDVINGMGGTDTLKAAFTANGQTIKPSLTSIENVVVTVTAVDTKAFTLDANNNADIQKLTVKDAASVSTTAVTNADELITISNLNRASVLAIDGGSASTVASGGTGSVITATFKDAVAADTQKVDISNGGKTAFLTLSTAETVEITATGTGTKANTIGSLNAGSTKTLNIKGDGKLTIAASDLAGTVTVDASTNKGGVDFTAEASTTLTFKGGEGNDRLVIKPAELTSADSVDMGAGTNTLALTTITKIEKGTTSNTDITATELAAINAAKNVQVIEGTADSITKVNFADITQKTVKLSGDVKAGLAVAGIETGDILALSKSNTAYNGDAITLQGAGPNQTAQINIGGAASVAISATDATANKALVTDTGVSTVKINSTTAAASKTGVVNSFALAATTNATHTVDNSAAGSFILTGDVDFTIASGKTAGFTKAVDFNAADFTGKLTLAGSADIDIIKVGSAGSVITGLGGADKITLGTGVDQVVYTNKNQSVAGTQDVITGFKASGADKIVLSGITTAEVSTSVLANVQSAVNALVTGATLTNALDAAANAATTNNGLVWFEFGGNTYALVEATGATTTYVATDLVIQLVGTGLNLAYTDFTAAVA